MADSKITIEERREVTRLLRELDVDRQVEFYMIIRNMRKLADATAKKERKPVNRSPLQPPP